MSGSVAAAAVVVEVVVEVVVNGLLLKTNLMVGSLGFVVGPVAVVVVVLVVVAWSRSTVG